MAVTIDGAQPQAKELSDVMCVICSKPLEKLRVEAIKGTSAALEPMHVTCKVERGLDEPKKRFGIFDQKQISSD